MRGQSAGLPTSSSKPRWAPTRDFATFFSPSLEDVAWSQAQHPSFSKRVAEEWAPRRLKSAMVLTISTPGEKI